MNGQEKYKMVKNQIDLKKRLISEGLKIVQDKGMKNISLRQIAEKCGVTHSTPYRHFKDKNTYLAALVEQISIIFGTTMAQKVTDNMSGNAMLLQMGINFVNFAQDFPKFFDVLFLGDYVVQTKVTGHEIISDKTLPGFEEFKYAVAKLSKENNLGVDNDLQEIQLWSFIIGFALIVGKKNVVEVDSKWISKVIDEMISIYINGDKTLGEGRNEGNH